MTISTIIILLFPILLSTNASSPRGWEAAYQHENHGKEEPPSCPTPTVVVTDTGDHHHQLNSLLPLLLLLGIFLAGVAVGYTAHIWVLALYPSKQQRQQHMSTTTTSTTATRGNDLLKQENTGENGQISTLKEDKENGISHRNDAVINSQQQTSAVTPPSSSHTTAIVVAAAAAAAADNAAAAHNNETTTRTAPVEEPATSSITHQQIEPTTAIPKTVSIASMVEKTLASMDLSQMNTLEKLQAMMVGLQSEANQQAKMADSTANQYRREQRDIHALKTAHTIAKDTSDLSRRASMEFRKSCSDSLSTGVVVMTVAGGYCAWQRGLFLPLSTHCGALPTYLRGPFGIWTAWRSVEVGWCMVSGVVAAGVGALLLAVAPMILYRTQLVSDYEGVMPVAKILMSLGIACGTVGYQAVNMVGGDGRVWVCLWELWTFFHIILSVTAHRIMMKRVKKALGNPQLTFEMGAVGGLGGGVTMMMWLVLGIVLPLAMGVVPFHEDVYVRIRAWSLYY